jgi:NADH dehydrogenase
MSNDAHLIVGATGLVGSQVCRLLAEGGHKVRALVRGTANPEKLVELKKLGAEFAEGDLKDQASLERACRGAGAVISTASSTLSRQAGDSIQTVDLEGQLRLVDAAKAAGIGRFVFLSFRNNPAIQYPLTRAKRAVEQRLRESGLNYTSLQASYFMEIWLSPVLGFDYAHAKARIYGTGQNAISWISSSDVAQVAVGVLASPAAQKTILEIGGPEALSPLEVVKIFEQASGRKFELEHVPEDALRAQLAGATDPLQQTFAALTLQCAAGDAIDMRRTPEFLRSPLASVRDYARRLLT